MSAEGEDRGVQKSNAEGEPPSYPISAVVSCAEEVVTVIMVYSGEGSDIGPTMLYT